MKNFFRKIEGNQLKRAMRRAAQPAIFELPGGAGYSILDSAAQPLDLVTFATLYNQNCRQITGNVSLTSDAPQSNQIDYNSTYRGTPANGDSGDWTIPLLAGVYVVTVIGAIDSNAAIIDWRLNGSIVQAGQDWYNAVQTFNTFKTFGLTVSYNGLQTLLWTVNGKNASSSNYYFRFQRVAINKV